MSCGDKIRIAIVVSEFNYDVTRVMEEKAIDHARFLGAEVSLVARSPGTFDTPFIVSRLLATHSEVDAVAVLGAVIKGDTKHDEVVAHQAARKLLDLSIEYGKPVTLGIIGPGASRLEAIERAEEYARRAVESAVKLARRSKELSGEC
ncbi:6,7-dimethyl-8-ribityllumazine synthase [Aeropyrum pernix K1]|uniref:6,7-dimethyl-8-ribityllumazine synthase n=1 Tax=Aeropyrum pernix (strain ATCC 700893 / DSM 11879 / JCM 9820 / NBRC 100138 / K1) TaxID=272557 RepID=RISB_AERPE|nr:6,7-dimethyl-8-ribityllumazine synthase [Aeropyrum pernix]Q9YC88.2 RecName: Full=6,7-dimethyl-8-ribityllumazine synthase; Short=DMRL synthase; Short=LS; Short=Lumazine synthase [Aeropyrum pernix K1]BAA80360.2 6,7-dimethyl-8-ribityllumazine synthase [Aeropyrum pernix K1]